MRIESAALIGIAAAAVLFSLARLADTRLISGGEDNSVRYTIQTTGLDAEGRSILWIVDQSTGKIKVCGIHWGDDAPGCTPDK